MAYICRYCEVSGSSEAVISYGAHHRAGCTRFRSDACSESLFYCRFCGCKGSSTLVGAQGPHHEQTCIRFVEKTNNATNLPFGN